jgi:hypothetical protein
MSRLRSASRPGWLTLGLVVGAILAPATAVAVTATAVNIVGNNHTAAVSPGGQVREIEMDPSTWFHTSGLANFSSCTDLGTPSTTRAIILKHLNVQPVGFTGTNGQFGYLSTGPSCGGATIQSFNFANYGVTSLPLGQGVALPAGTHLSVWGANVQVQVDVFGYTITKSAVSAGAATLRSVGPPAKPSMHEVR